MKKVYIETSIISYCSARPSSNILAAARQQITWDWWATQRARFALYTSALVEREALQGDPDAAADRREMLKGIPMLALTQGVRDFAKKLIVEKILPAKAGDDAVHIAIAACHGMDYLMTWNCRHIHNAQAQPAIRFACVSAGLKSPEICTPEELMGNKT